MSKKVILILLEILILSCDLSINKEQKPKKNIWKARIWKTKYWKTRAWKTETKCSKNNPYGINSNGRNKGIKSNSKKHWEVLQASLSDSNIHSWF